METRVGIILASLLTGTGLCCQKTNTPRILVMCVDADAKPIANAEIHVWQYRPQPDGGGKMQHYGPFASDAAGLAKTAVALTYRGGRFDRWVYARVAGKLVGAARRLVYAKPKDDTAEAIEVALQPSRSVRGRVAVPDGFARDKVRIRVMGLNGMIGDNPWAQPFPRQSSITSLRNSLPERFDCAVNDEGAFELQDMPENALLYIAAEAPGLAQAQWFNARRPGRLIPESIDLEMQPEAAFGGTVVAHDGKPCGNAEVILQIQRVEGAGVRDSFRTTTDDTGAYRLTGLPPGQFSLAVESKAGVFRPMAVELAKQERRTKEPLQLELGVEVRGVVVEYPGRKPVPAVSVAAICDDDQHTRLGHGSTDELGRFSMRLPAGVALLYFSGIPDGFAYPKPQVVTTLQVAKDTLELTHLQLELSRK